MAAKLIHLCGVGELADGAMRRVERPGVEPLAVYRIGSTYYATDDTCTHGSASLADGELSEFLVVCPFHFGTFDIRTGEPMSAPACFAVRTYQTMIKDGEVFAVVDLPDDAAPSGRAATPQ